MKKRTIKTNSGIPATIEKRTQRYDGETIERDVIQIETSQGIMEINLAHDGSHSWASVFIYPNDAPALLVYDHGKLPS